MPAAEKPQHMGDLDSVSLAPVLGSGSPVSGLPHLGGCTWTRPTPAMPTLQVSGNRSLSTVLASLQGPGGSLGHVWGAAYAG